MRRRDGVKGLHLGGRLDAGAVLGNDVAPLADLVRRKANFPFVPIHIVVVKAKDAPFHAGGGEKGRAHINLARIVGIVESGLAEIEHGLEFFIQADGGCVDAFHLDGMQRT